MEERLVELPKGWARARIIDLVGKDGVFIDGDWVETKDQDPNGGVRLIQLADIGDGFYRNRSNRFLTKEKAIQLNCTFLQPNDVLIARMPDPLGRACIFPGDPKLCVTAVDVCIVRPSSRIANNRWLMNTINAVQFRSEIESLQSGSTRKRISRSNLATLLLPLPPPPEQHRIVAKIEELFTRLDAGVEALKKIKAQLKRYRQAVLKWAFEGKLTQEWREAHRGELEPASALLERIKEKRGQLAKQKLEDMQPLDKADLPELPAGWVWASSRSLAWFVTSGSRDWKKYYSHSGAIFIRTQDINTNKLSLENVAFVSLPKKVEGKRSLVQKNDLLIIITGANVGKVALVDRELDEAYVSQSVALIKLAEPNIAKFVHLAMIAEGYGKTQLEKMVYGMGRPVLSLENVQNIPLPLPPLAEQNQIVSEIESRLSIADNMEKVAEQSLKQSDRLRQSILKRAFEGKLVPQDPTDEPAEKLLERIKEEKAKREAENRGEKKHRNKKSKQMELI